MTMSNAFQQLSYACLCLQANCGPDGGLIIHGCAWSQKVGHVCNVHTQLQITVFQLTYVQCVIDIFATGWIHAADG